MDELALFAADARLALGEQRATGYLRKFYPWYLAGYPVPASELSALLTLPTAEAAIARLREFSAAPAAA